MFFIYSYPNGLEVISRRFVIKHSEGLLTKETYESIVLFNSGDTEICEMALEMEEYRNELSVKDDKGCNIPFLPKDQILQKPIDQEVKDKLDKNKLYLSYIVFKSGDSGIKPKSYKMIEFRYWEHGYQECKEKYENIEENSVETKKLKPNNPKLIHINSISKFYIPIRFYCAETVNLSFSFEEGITHNNGLFLIAEDNHSKILNKKIEKEFHYEPLPNRISLGISGRKRVKNKINLLNIYYSVVPTSDILYFLNGITIFSLLFPFVIYFFYMQFQNLSLFAIMSTSDLLAIISLGVARFQTGLISIKTRLTVSLTLLAFFYIVLLLQ